MHLGYLGLYEFGIGVSLGVEFSQDGLRFLVSVLRDQPTGALGEEAFR
jgi:hypothetical protein